MRNERKGEGGMDAERHGVHLTTGNASLRLTHTHTQSDAQTQSRTKALLGF